MIAWGVLKKQIVTGILKDAQQKKYDDDALLYYARGACVELSFHTAQADSHVFNCDGVQYQFIIPDDAVDNIEDTGLIGWFTESKTEYLPALSRHPGSLWPTPTPNMIASGSQLAVQTSTRDFPRTNTTYKTPGYWEYPTGVMTLSFIPAKDDQIVLQYFKVWTPPTSDESIMLFPMWMEKPFAYILSAYALDPAGVSATNIRQFNDKTQSGTPEMNPPLKQAQYFLEQARRLLAMHRTQNRETFYKESLQV